MIRRLFPWIIAGCAMIMLMISNGMVITGITAFDEALIDEFGWGRGTLKFRDLLTFLITGAIAPFLGVLIDRLGVRPLMVVGSVLLAAGYLAYSQISQIAHVYIIHAVFAAVLVACGLNVAVIMVSQWFVRRRGTAIGLALVGTSLGGMVFPPIIVALTAAYGWRGAFAVLAAVPMLILLIGIFLARRPDEVGLQPLGHDDPPKQGGSIPDPARDLTLAEALKTPTFWALATTAMMTFYAMLAASSHLFLHMRDLAFEPMRAGQALSVMFGMALIGKFAFGFMADVFNQKRVFMANIGVMFGGSLLLASLQPDLVWIAIVLFGLGWGGLYTLLQLQAVNSFGLTAAGKILGTITVVDALGGGLGIWLTGVLYDSTGSYALAFGLISGLLLLALLAASRIRPEVKPVAQSAAASKATGGI